MNEVFTESALSDLIKEELLRDFYFCQYMDRCVLKNKTIEIKLSKISEITREVLDTVNNRKIQCVIYRAVKEILSMTFHSQVEELEYEKRIKVRLV